MDGSSTTAPSTRKERSASYTIDEFKEEHFTHLSRRIQLELRDKEMIELANEAERAAEAGQERFVGFATTFNLGLDYDPRKTNGYQQTPTLTDDNPHITGPKHIRTPSDSDSRFHNLNKRDLSTPKTRDSQHHSPVDTPVSSIHSTTLFLPPSVRKDSLPRVRVMKLKPIEEVVPTFKDMHEMIRQNFIQQGIHLQQGVSNDVVEVSTTEKYCPKDCIFTHPSKYRYITNYFYTPEKNDLKSNSQDSTQPITDITCGRDSCQDTSCVDISCLMIDSTIKSFFQERQRSKSTIIFNEDISPHPDSRHVRFGSITFRLPRHEF